MRCQWCHNPESQNYLPEILINKEGRKEAAGKQYVVEELVGMLQKDQIFYDQSGGGVTLSGGEVMVQDMDYLEILLNKLRQLGISVAIDTCGYAPTANFQRVISYTDLFLYDLKMMDAASHELYTKVSNQQILENLVFLSSSGARIWLRLILVHDVNVDHAAIRAIGNWLKENKIAPEVINLLPYHAYGRDKYGQLGRECTQNFTPPTDDEVSWIRDYLLASGFRVRVGG